MGAFAAQTPAARVPPGQAPMPADPASRGLDRARRRSASSTSDNEVYTRSFRSRGQSGAHRGQPATDLRNRTASRFTNAVHEFRQHGRATDGTAQRAAGATGRLGVAVGSDSCGEGLRGFHSTTSTMNRPNVERAASLLELLLDIPTPHRTTAFPQRPLTAISLCVILAVNGPCLVRSRRNRALA